MASPIDREAEPTGPIDRDELVGEAIEAYLELAEAGSAPDVEEFARGYPDLGDDLVAALEGLALVQGLVGEVNGPGHRLEEGRRVAGYRIVKELGRGGMGIVYEAVHVALDRPVALKVLGTQAAPDSSGRRRFLNEAKTAAGLHHTHIVPVWDVGQVGGLCYYAMQRIEGSGLDRVLRTLRRDRSVAAGSTMGSGSRKSAGSPAPKPSPRPGIDGSLAASGLGDETLSWRGLGDMGGGASWRRREPADQPATFTPPRGSAYYRWVAEVGRQAADALAHAHQRGVIHRDIKPSNLLVDARGMIWVADFGLARRLADPSQTQFDSMLGTPRYMSPEQARTGVLDGRADIYSLGATLYELITLRPPFDGQSAAELIEQIKTREPARPRKFDARVPLDLETILLEALADDLGRFLAHEPVKARRIGPVGRMVRFARRHPSLTAVSTAATVMVLATATVAYVRIARERDRADLAAEAALKAKGNAEAALGQVNETNKKYRIAILDSLEKQAEFTSLISKEPNRRSRGLRNLKDAADLKPDPALTIKLRNLALAFLSMRDVEERPAIDTRDNPQHGLIFGADGGRLAGISDDGNLEIWDVPSQKLVAATTRPVGPTRMRPMNNGRDGRSGGGGGGRGRFGTRSVAAGDQIAVIKPDGTGVRFFDPARLEAPVATLETKGHLIGSLYASSDGRRLLTLDQPAQTNPNRPGSPDRPERPGPPDFQDEIRITLWDRDKADGPKATLVLPLPAKLDQPFPMPSRLLAVAIAPDGSKIAAARMGDPEITLWDGEGRLLPPIPVQANTTALALGPAGLLAVAGTGGEIALWDLSFAKPKHLPSLPLHQSFVNRLRFSPRNGSLLAATGMGGIELWDLSNHTMIADFSTRENVEDLAFSPDGQTLAAAQPSSIALWSVVEPTGQHVLPETGERPGSLAFGRDDLLAITSFEANLPAPLRLWGGPGQCPPSVHAWDQIRPNSVGFDNLGRLITTESDAIRWYQPPSSTPVAEVEIPAPGRPGSRPSAKTEAPPSGSPRLPGAPIIARTPDGRTLLLSRPNGLLLWRAEAPSTVKRVDLNERIEAAGRGQMPFVGLDPSGSRIYYLTSSRNDQLKLTARPLEGNEARPPLWSLNVNQMTTLAVSPDGKILAYGDRSGAVFLVDAIRGIAKERLSPPDDETGPVESLAFAPDSRTLAIGAREQVRLWAIEGRPRLLVLLPGHRGSIRSLSFDTRGSRLAGADEKTIKVWDLGSLRSELARLGLDW